MKTCKECHKDLPDTEFAIASRSKINGTKYLYARCVPCRNAIRREKAKSLSKICPQCNIKHLVTEHYKGDPMCMQCRDLKQAGKQCKRPRVELYEIHSKTPPPNLAHRNILWDDDKPTAPPYVIPKIPDILTHPIQEMLSRAWG